LLTRRGIQWFLWGLELTGWLILFGMILGLLIQLIGPILAGYSALFNRFSPYLLLIGQLMMCAGMLFATAAPRQNRASRWAYAALLSGIVATGWTIAVYQFQWPLQWAASRWMVVLLQACLMAKFLAVASHWIHDSEKLRASEKATPNVGTSDVTKWAEMQEHFRRLFRTGILVLVVSIAWVGVLWVFGDTLARTLGHRPFTWLRSAAMSGGALMGIVLLIHFSRAISAMFGNFSDASSYRLQGDEVLDVLSADRLRPFGILLGVVAVAATGVDWYANRNLAPTNVQEQWVKRLDRISTGQISRTIEREMNRSMVASQARARQENQDEARRIAALEAIGVQEARDIWEVNVRASGRSARELIAEMVDPIGWTIDDRNAEPLLNRRVSVVMSGASRLQVVEEVCRQIEVTPEYPSPLSDWDGGPMIKGLAIALHAFQSQGELPPSRQEQPKSPGGPALTFHAGARSLPVAHAGPVLIELSDLEENPPNATGRLTISAWAAGLPVAMLAIDQAYDFVSIKTIQDRSGTALINSALKTSGMFNFPWLQDQYRLRGLLRNVTEMTISGTVQLRIPTDITTIRFHELQQGAIKQVGDGFIEITQFNEAPGSGQRTVAIRYNGIPRVKPMFAGLDTEERVLRADGVFFSSAGSSGQADFSFDGDVTTLIVKLVRSETVRYEFTMPRVGLTQFRRQPKQLVELDYSGHPAPASVAVRGFKKDGVFNKVRLQCTNHSNKDIAEIRFELNYLGEDGNTLKTHQGSDSGPSPDKPLLPRHQEAERSVTAFFMPPEATGVAINLTGVSFTDGTTWVKQSQSGPGR
jgi:hypothetical protein